MLRWLPFLHASLYSSSIWSPFNKIGVKFECSQHIDEVRLSDSYSYVVPIHRTSHSFLSLCYFTPACTIIGATKALASCLLSHSNATVLFSFFWPIRALACLQSFVAIHDFSFVFSLSTVERAHNRFPLPDSLLYR